MTGIRACGIIRMPFFIDFTPGNATIQDMYHRAKAHWKNADPILYEAAKLHAIADIRRSRDVFGDLVFAIVNQQLSGKAAQTIHGRLEAAVGRSGITPRSVSLKLKIPTLRKCGLSEAKSKDY